jgi:glycosyltransferase involved in cell wall biosynthesis
VNSNPAPPYDVSVVVPLYRTADTIEELCERVAGVMASNRWSYQLILVNDRSPEDDLREAQRMAARNEAVCVLDLDHNRGQNSALMIGLEVTEGRWVVMLDGDLQDPPEAIPRLLETAESGFDVVFGGRHGCYESWFRRLTSSLFKTVQSSISGVPRDAGLFAVLSARQVRALAAWPVEDPKVVPMIGLSRARVTSVPVERQKRPRGTTSYSGWKRLRVGLSILAFAARWRWAPPRSSKPVDRMSMVARRFGNCATPGGSKAE